MADLPLDDFQFELDGYRWGIHRPISTDKAGFDPGTNGWATQDSQSSYTGATRFGRDVRTAQTWTWNLHVDQVDEETALNELAAMGALWFGGSAGAPDGRLVKMLRYRVAGRTRVIFGRPRDFDYKPDNLLLNGYLPPQATFQKADALHYDDTELDVDMVLGAAATGGFEWPATFPLTFNLNEDYVPPWSVVVGGDAPTHPIVEFTGPVLNPKVQIGSFSFALNGLIPEGGKVTIDTRPWAQTVKHSGPAGSASLSASSRLSKAKLIPGAYDALFTGVDATGQGRCRVRWRNAWHTL